MSSVCEPLAAAIHAGKVIDHPSGYLALSPRNRRFLLPRRSGFIAYRPQGMHLIALGGVHAPEEEWEGLLDGFLALARQQRRRVLAVQVRAAQASLFRGRGFSVNAFGATYALRLAGFSCAGGRRMKVRQKVRQARAAGLRVLEVGVDCPRDPGTFARLQAVSDAWLAAKGKRELDFMVGELGTPAERERRIFVAADGFGLWQGFITYVPAWGERPGLLHDLTRRRPEAPVGCMELCNAEAIARFASEGIEYLHFGFTPFVVEGGPYPGENPLLAWLLRMLWRYGSAVYPARSQAAYKLKWAPDYVEPEFLACRPFSWRAVLDLLRVTRSL
jgi:lysylphosphatidylglycerol synthetase-like protein (DUF2156 family)